jgi:hypothetical protein
MIGKELITIARILLPNLLVMQVCAIPENEHYQGIGGEVRQVNFFRRRFRQMNFTVEMYATLSSAMLQD